MCGLPKGHSINQAPEHLEITRMRQIACGPTCCWEVVPPGEAELRERSALRLRRAAVDKIHWVRIRVRMR